METSESEFYTEKGGYFSKNLCFKKGESSYNQVSMVWPKKH